jgi:MYXO-CTERM domain-containing protein
MGDAKAGNSSYPAVMQLQKGYGGPEGEQGGPGTEQSFSEVLQVEGKLYVVTIWMSSDVSEDDAPWQGKCSSVLLSPKDSPKVVVDQKQISAYHNGDRLFNHPIGAANGNARVGKYGTHIVYAFGSDGNVDGNDNGNVQTYAGVINHMCEITQEPIRISENNNNNEGAPAGVFNQTMGGDSYFTFGYLSQGGNDVSYARGLVLHADGTLEKTYLTEVVTPANIGRPTIAAMSADRSFFCAAQGDNRPPEDGVRCAYLDAMTGEVKTSKIVAASDPNAEPKIYMNQPQVALMDNGRVALMAMQSDGAGKNNNNKGAQLSHLYMLEPTDGGIQEDDHITNIGKYQTHPTICSGKWGVDGKMTVGFVDASITGVGEPLLQTASYDPVTKFAQLDQFSQIWIVGFHADSGYLANLYGQNPNTQGRDFLRCMGDVPNPGHGVAGGFMSTVETFFVAPHSGRQKGENKNALFLSFVPAKVDVPTEPAPPQPVDPGGGSTDPGTTSGGTDPGPTPGTGAGTNPTSTQLPGTAKSGCACSTESTGDSGAPGALALMGLAMLFASRRRKEG